jgi:hypothetical protein
MSLGVTVTATLLNTIYTGLIKDKNNTKIEFNESDHTYVINDGKDQESIISVTSFIKQKFPDFDKESKLTEIAELNIDAFAVEEEWEQLNTEGKQMHKRIENYLKSGRDKRQLNFLKKEDNLFFRFMLQQKYVTLASEFMIYDPQLKIAGTIDALFISEESYKRRFFSDNNNNNNNNNDDDLVEDVILVDWKRIKKLHYSSINNEIGFHPFDFLQKTNHTLNSMQVNMYKYILEKNYNVRVCKMFLVILHPINDEPVICEIPYLEEVQKLMISERETDLQLSKIWI